MKKLLGFIQLNFTYFLSNSQGGEDKPESNNSDSYLEHKETQPNKSYLIFLEKLCAFSLCTFVSLWFKFTLLRKPYILLAFLFLIIGCTPKEVITSQATTSFLTKADATIVTNQEREQMGKVYDVCNTPLSYATDSAYLNHSPEKYIRVNYHFMNASDSSKNYNGIDAYRFAQSLTIEMNRDLKNNRKMWLPQGNDTKVLPLRFSYRLFTNPEHPEAKGVYCHYDDKLYKYVHIGYKDYNLFDRTVIKKYRIGADSVLNIFILPHHPDSVASRTYNEGAVGVALGNALKVAGLYETGQEAWAFRGIVNHEIGHVLGLAHTWAYNDGCDDTPKNPNCWGRTKTPPCNTQASNNVMDYNASKRAWTPCQIGRVRRNFSILHAKQRKLLVKTWCKFREKRHIYIADSVHWKGAKDLEGHITIEDGATLEINCRISLPPNGKIIVKPRGKLILNNAHLHQSCGKKWQGIEIHQIGEQKGEVVLMGTPRLENMKNPL